MNVASKAPRFLRNPVMGKYAMLLLMLGLWFIFYLGRAFWQLYQPLELDHPRRFDIPNGASLQQITRRLVTEGILADSRALAVFVRLSGRASEFQAGQFEVQPGMTSMDLIELFTSGQVVRHSVQFIEGTSYRDVLKKLRVHPEVENDLPDEDMAVGALLELELNVHPEGQFFPDTYHFNGRSKASMLLLRAHERLTQLLSRHWQSRMASLPLKTPYEALVLASLIEKETGIASERLLIASVFVNRLRLGMRLETDPTVIYGLGSRYEGNLTRRHLRLITPYNTYRIKGLPPTPIALVGEEAIKAALQPVQSKALYFVAKGDGSHYFSSNYQEHQRAVSKFQRHERTQNYRSSPP